MPAIIPDDVIIDIVNQRGIPKARIVLGKKHGLTPQRIETVWRRYYGGSTLAHFKSGLKCPLPGSEVPQPDSEVRETTVGDKKLKVQMPNVRAIPIQRNVKINKKENSRELELVPIGDPIVDDQNAQIISGEIASGNDSSELIDALYQFIDVNKNLSEDTRKALNSAEKFYKRSNISTRSKRGKKYVDSESDQEAAYDSTKYDSEFETEKTGGSSERLPVEPPESSSDSVHERRSSVQSVPIEPRLVDNFQYRGENRGLPQEPRSRSVARAQPIHSVSARRQESRPEASSRYNPRPDNPVTELQQPQLYRGGQTFQQNPSSYNNEFNQRQRELPDVYRQSQDGSGQNRIVRPI